MPCSIGTKEQGIFLGYSVGAVGATMDGVGWSGAYLGCRCGRATGTDMSGTSFFVSDFERLGMNFGNGKKVFQKGFTFSSDRSIHISTARGKETSSLTQENPS